MFKAIRILIKLFIICYTVCWKKFLNPDENVESTVSNVLARNLLFMELIKLIFDD